MCVKKNSVFIYREQQEKKLIESKFEALNIELNDLNHEMKNFKQKESENLLFTSKLTEKSTRLQSENSILNEKVN